MKKIIVKIDGMSCNHCRAHVEEYLNEQDGVSASVDLENAQASVEYDEAKVTVEDLERFVEEAGYVSLGVEES